ncbi:MAG: small basic protein [Candidatus Omnitrophica bacterium]|nr:small basic protein [Candidatus Omnitrophota bacterium]
MSIHPSLKATKGNKLRSVLKRYERIEKIKNEGKWEEEKSAFGLIKGKVLKVKIKKAAKTAETATAGKDAAKPAAKAAAKTAKK